MKVWIEDDGYAVLHQGIDNMVKYNSEAQRIVDDLHFMSVLHRRMHVHWQIARSILFGQAWTLALPSIRHYHGRPNNVAQ